MGLLSSVRAMFMASSSNTGSHPTNGIHRPDLVNVTLSIEQDFRRLAELLDRTMSIVDAADEEMVLSLKSTKSVAERGVRLARRLSKLSRRRTD